MPQRKDPDIPVRVAVAMTPWPGVQAQEVEQLVTRPIEEKIAENSSIHPGTAADYGIRSVTLPGLSIVYVQLAESVNDTKRQLSDINLKLNALNGQLPQGAGPIQFQSDFGDTAALMLTIASPRLSNVEIAIRARSVQKAVEETRGAISEKSGDPRVAALYCFPESISPDAVRRGFDSFSQEAQHDGVSATFGSSRARGSSASTAALRKAMSKFRPTSPSIFASGCMLPNFTRMPGGRF